MVLGIDEAGRGPWAGPLVVGACVLGPSPISGLTDSKKLSAKKRQELFLIIKQQALGYGLGWVSAKELDELGMSQALILATKRAVEQITTSYTEIIIDGTINFLAGTGKEKFVTTLPKADLLIPSVSAASILAKVSRDEYMARLDEKYPGYGFSKHAGYGVAAHRQAIENLGVSPEHRLSFKPLATYRPANYAGWTGAKSGSTKTSRASLNTRKTADESEDLVAAALEKRGHEIVARNWRTKYCEIDIVSRFQNTLYFTEVKHRKENNGFDSITPARLRRMHLASQMYAASQSAPTAGELSSLDMRLAVATTAPRANGRGAILTNYVLLD